VLSRNRTGRMVAALVGLVGLTSLVAAAGCVADAAPKGAQGTSDAASLSAGESGVGARAASGVSAVAADRSIGLYWEPKIGARWYRISVRSRRAATRPASRSARWGRWGGAVRLPTNSRQFVVTVSGAGKRLVNGHKYQVRLQYRTGTGWRTWTTFIRTPRYTQPVAATPCGVTTTPATWEHVVWIIMENHGSAQTVGSSEAPYFNSLISRCGLASNFFAITHPSLPNYLAMTSGSTHGVVDDKLPIDHQLAVPNLFAQLGAGQWRTLAESMPGNCVARNSGDYVARHNPATYYPEVAAQCATQDQPLSGAPDLSSRFTLIVPNNKSNTHDTDVRYGDTWLASVVPQLLDSPQYRAGRTVVFITYDEDSGNEGNHIPALVLAPSVVPGTRDSTRYTLYSLLRTTEEILGVPLLANASAAPSMRSGFRL